MNQINLTVKEYNKSNPCIKCLAPCCQIIMIPHKVPLTFMDLDFIRYLINFTSIDVAISRLGEWLILIRDICRHLDQESHLCKVHGTDEQPLTCQYYNPHQCWYKRNFASADPGEIYVLTCETFEYWLQRVLLNDNGEVVSVPDFEESQKILNEWRGQQKQRQAGTEYAQSLSQ